MSTKVLKDGKVMFAVHGVFGTAPAKKLFDEDPIEDDDLLDGGGLEMLRYFDTEAEANAYVLALNDMDGWNEYAFTTPEEHEKYFGNINIIQP